MSTAKDLRTREGRRSEIVAHIVERGGFSVFWVTDNLLRAKVATEMEERGEIVVTPKHYPWSDARVVKSKGEMK